MGQPKYRVLAKLRGAAKGDKRVDLFTVWEDERGYLSMTSKSYKGGPEVVGIVVRMTPNADPVTLKPSECFLDLMPITKRDKDGPGDFGGGGDDLPLGF